MLENRGEYERALNLYLHLFEKHPDYNPFYEGVIRGFVASQKHAEGLAWVDSLKEVTQGKARLSDLTASERERLGYIIVDGGRFCGHLGKREEALVRWEELYSLPRVNQNPFIRLFSAMIGVRYPDGLEEMARRARKVTGVPHLLSATLANYWANRGQLDRALDEWLWLMEVQPRQAGSIKRQILNLPEDENTRRQIETGLKAALARPVIRLQVTELLGELYFRNRDWEAAYEQVRAADQQSNGQGIALMTFAENLITEAQFGIALEILGDLVLSHPQLADSPRGLLTRARALEGSEAYTEADSVYNRLTMTENLRTAQGQEAIILQANLRLKRLHRPAQARELLEEGLKRLPRMRNRSDAALLTADTYLVERNLQRARETYLQASDGNLGRDVEAKSKALVNAAKVDFYLGEIDSAMTRLQVASKHNPAGTLTNDALEMMEMLRNSALDSSGLSLFAEAELEERLSNVQVAESLYVRTAELAQSGDLVERALRKTATIRRSQHRIEEALQTLEAAFNRFPKSLKAPEILLEMGAITEIDLADPKQAIELYEKILLDYPESLQAEEARRRIRKLESQQT